MTKTIADKNRGFRKSIGCLVLCLLVILTTHGAASLAVAATDEEYQALEKRMKAVEDQLAAQSKIIEQQQRWIDRMAGQSPEIKKLMTPAEPSVRINKFIINGANLFTAADFDKILSRYRGKTLSMTQLKGIADELTALYRSKGYVSSQVYLPAQEISDNTAEFKVTEGRIGEITVEDGKYIDKELIEKQLTIKEGQILDYDKLNKDIENINLQPDRNVQAVLKPGAKEGTSDVVVKMKEDQRPWHFLADYSNRGTKYTTMDRYGIGFVHNNLLGNDDIFTIGGHMGDASNIYSYNVDYNMPLSFMGWNKTRFGGYYARSNSVISNIFSVLNPEGDATAWGAYLTQSLFDTNIPGPVDFTFKGGATVGLDGMSVHNRLLNQETSHDEIRVVKTTLDFDEKDEWGRTFANESLRLGLDGFLGSMDRYDEKSSRLDASSRFVKNNGTFTRITRVPFSSYVVNTVRYQIASDPLPQEEQFVIGGADTVRGYPENEYFGDMGYTFNAELRTPAFIFPDSLKMPFDPTRTAMRDAFQFAFFIDYGGAMLMKARVGEVKSMYLVGAGVGVMFDLYKGLKGRVDYGMPLSKTPSDNSDGTFHIGVGYQW